MQVSAVSTEHTHPVFGGHEKFVFRQGWLKKGIDLVETDPTIFTRTDALVQLGVGKNMVRSIRHWCLATGVLESSSGGHRSALQATILGRKLFANNGWDPYLEDPGTLWLLHWQLVSDLYYGFLWHILFTRVVEREFTRQHLTEVIGRQLERQGIQARPGTVEREVDVCLRTYVSGRMKSAADSEDSLDCPLAELGIIRPTREERLYSFAIGPKPLLPTQIFGYALLHFLAQIAQHRRTVAVDESIYKPGSPGQAFKLDEDSVVAYLESLEELTSGDIRLNETAGLKQIYLYTWPLDNVSDYALNLLQSYYE